jgi:hypothetical protein
MQLLLQHAVVAACVVAGVVVVAAELNSEAIQPKINTRHSSKITKYQKNYPAYAFREVSDT